MNLSELESQIERFFSLPDTDLSPVIREEALEVFARFKNALDCGEVRAASRKPGGPWTLHPWVKRGILLGFRLGGLADYSINDNFRYFDKDTYPTKPLTINDGVRIVPGGSTVRSGAYLGRG